MDYYSIQQWIIIIGYIISCYDRIVMPLASLCSQQIGMPPSACKLFLKTLALTKYHIKTSHGISDSYYNTTNQTNIHGPGQGGRGSPAIWVAISSILMKCMEWSWMIALWLDWAVFPSGKLTWIVSLGRKDMVGVDCVIKWFEQQIGRASCRERV